MPRMFFDGTYHPKNLRNHIRNDFPKRKKGWSTAINKPPGHQKKMITTSRRDLTGMMGSLRADYPKVAEVFRLVNYHNLPKLTITQKDVSCILQYHHQMKCRGVTKTGAAFRRGKTWEEEVALKSFHLGKPWSIPFNFIVPIIKSS